MYNDKNERQFAWTNLWLWLGQELVWHRQMVQLILVRVSKPANRRMLDA